MAIDFHGFALRNSMDIMPKYITAEQMYCVRTELVMMKLIYELYTCRTLYQLVTSEGVCCS
jgi:hypothetical protein